MDGQGHHDILSESAKTKFDVLCLVETSFDGFTGDGEAKYGYC